MKKMIKQPSHPQCPLCRHTDDDDDDDQDGDPGGDHDGDEQD